MEKLGTFPIPTSFMADDGYLLKGFTWRYGQPAPAARPVVLINRATSVRCRYYSRFADFLHAHWRDYARHRRIRLLIKWHVLMPALTAIFGYFPGSRLGWLEDTPRGVVRDWTVPHPRFEDNWRSGSLVLPESERRELVARFAAMRAATLALSLSDDEFGTVEAIRRLLGYFRGSHRTHLHLTPEAVRQKSIGHFAFFHSRFEHSLWKIALEWLLHGRLPPQQAGAVATFKAECHAVPGLASAGA